jgi:transcriptional regulator with XRE-family HTH domain
LLGAQIFESRKLCPLSSRNSGPAAEVHVSHIGGLERDVRNPSHATLLRVAAGLRVEPGQLVIEADRLREADSSYNGDLLPET